MICMFILRRNTRRLNRKWFYGEARNRTCDPGVQAVVFGRVPWLYQYWPGGIIVFVVLYPGTASQKTGQRRSDRVKMFI